MISTQLTTMTFRGATMMLPVNTLWRHTTPSIVPHPFLLLFSLLAVSSDHLSVLCFNPLVAASSSAASSSPSSNGGETGLPFSRSSPYNLTITSVEARAATVHWDPSPAIYFTTSHNSSITSSNVPPSNGDYGNLQPITSFKVTLRPTIVRGTSDNHNAQSAHLPTTLSSTSSKEMISDIPTTPRVVRLEGHRRSFSFQDLSPRTEYQVVIVAYSGDGRGNVTDTVTFTTLLEDESTIIRSSVQPTEVVLVVLILIAWFCAIALFLHQWGKIRVIQPREPGFKHSPKNLDTIKVVKKPTDSVIHKHYTRQVSRTMLMRESKRIERMNTMPNIKVNLEPLHHDCSNSSKEIQKKFQTMPEIEMENLSADESQT